MKETHYNNLGQAKRKLRQWLQDSWCLARPYWTSEDRWRAIGLVTLVIIFNLLTVYMSVLFNKWNNSIYDALQHLDKTAFFQLFIKYGWMLCLSILFQVCAYYFRKILEIRWRRWMTKDYLTNWLAKHAYYKTRFVANYVDNPDQRISQDISSFISLSLSLTLGLISNVVSLFSFVFILWHLSGPLAFSALGHHLVIPGYMVWVALLYALLGTYLTFKIGRPLIKLNFQQETVEANFRFGLMRVREYGEEIAFYAGEREERQGLVSKFTAVVDNFMAIVFRQLKINILNIGYSIVADVFPLLVAAPRYFAKAIQLGDLMQIAGAFGQVQGALSYFIDAYSSLAGWRAVMDRLYGFQHAITAAAVLEGIAKSATSDAYLAVENLALRLPTQSSQSAQRVQDKPFADNISFSLSSGSRLLIKGPSGSGKTTLLRSLAGLWPFASGKLSQDSTRRELFVGQRPYLPAVTLREAICYPLAGEHLPPSAQVERVLEQCGLSYLVAHLDSDQEWSKRLSLGEQQRVSFARILLNRPDIIYLDEATSALDEAMEAHLYQLLINELPESAIVSVGHRSTLRQWHTQELDFNQFANLSST